jgi:uncharacterized protein (DUF2236 family)
VVARIAGREDDGFFGPESVSWRVHRETTVLFGGARALLLQAAHPLVIAGARATGFYERNPWKRLERTLLLTYTLTFGTRSEALAAAERINQVHRRVKGVDPVTGKPYEGLDPDLLLWVHAVLVESALRFEALTVGALDDAGRQRFHEEQMLAAEMLLLPRDRIPPTVGELREYVRGVVASGDLVVTDAARTVASLFHDPPKDAEWRPVLRGVAWWAFGSLPEPLRSGYGFRMTPAKAVAMRASLRALRLGRPLIPLRYRHILIAQTAERRVQAFGAARAAA